MRNCYTFLLIIFLNILISCKHHTQQEYFSKIINSNQSISPDTLNLIYDGPKGFSLEYFPRDAISLAHINYCEIIEQGNSSNRVSRKIKFDPNGNLIKDENNSFSNWFKGTAIGSYQYLHDKSNKLLQMKGYHGRNNKDSVMTIWNYNQNGLLFSRDRFEFKKKIKPGRDGHLPTPEDFEKYPTWNKLETYKFSYSLNNAVIEKIVDGKIAEKNNYILQFDSLNRLQTIKKYEDATLVELTHYSYNSNSIIGNSKGNLNTGDEGTYKSKALFDEKGKQIQRIVLNDDGSDKVKMITTYNEDGTINNIRYRDGVQTFNYSYY